MIKTVVSVEGMACGMCEAHVNDAVREAFDVKSVKSSCKKKQTVIISDSNLDESELSETINKTGYQVMEIRSEAYKKRGLFGF